MNIIFQLENLILSECTEEPNFEVWKSLDVVQLNTNQCNEVEMVPSDVYFEIPQSHSTFGTIDLLFDEIRPEGDKSLIKRAAFKYSRNQKTGQAYLFIICMTNKGSTRCRGSPFILEFIISSNTSD